jgi:hypothetical protein
LQGNKCFFFLNTQEGEEEEMTADDLPNPYRQLSLVDFVRKAKQALRRTKPNPRVGIAPVLAGKEAQLHQDL